jgi:hypothetical protein
VKKECYEGLCTISICEKSLVSQTWEFTGRRQAKTCPTGSYCSSGECIPKVCKGEIVFDGGVQACPKITFNVNVHIEPFTTFCDKKKVYFKEGSCDGKIITSCSLKDGKCLSKYAHLDELGTTPVFVCVDLNGDGDFNDAGEHDSLDVNVNCNNCDLSRCRLSAGCTHCPRCGLTCGSYTNQYDEDLCLNPDQQCLYSCIAGSCGANHCASASSQTSGVFTPQLMQSVQSIQSIQSTQAPSYYVKGTTSLPCAK